MRRRELLALATGAAVLPWDAATAQQRRMARIALLIAESSGSEQFAWEFPKAMQKLGYIEGENVRYEIRSDGGKQERLPALAAEVVGLKPDLIVTWPTPAAFAAKQATRDIPIVMGGAGAPVETGLVASLSHPGGNITGVAGVSPQLAGKLVELIREMLPSARRVAALANAPDPFSKPFLAKIREAGEATGTAIAAMRLQGPDELANAFAEMAKDPPDAIIVQPTLGAERPAQLARQQRIPAVSIWRPFAEAGGLLSYSGSAADNYRRAARLADRVLKGAKPADLPLEQATQFELVINLKTAKALGITVPQILLARADEVIE